MEIGPIRNQNLIFWPLARIDEGQQKRKIFRTNRQSNLRCFCQSIFSLSRHTPTSLGGRSHIPHLDSLLFIPSLAAAQDFSGESFGFVKKVRPQTKAETLFSCLLAACPKNNN